MSDSKLETEEVSKKVEEMKKSLDFQSSRIVESEKKQKSEMENVKWKTEDQITELQNKLLLMEKQDRKYN